MLQRPFLVFADLESVLKRLEHPQGDAGGDLKVGLYAQALCGWLSTLSAPSTPPRNFYWEAVGENCVQEMIVELNALAERCIEEMKAERADGHDAGGQEGFLPCQVLSYLQGRVWRTRGRKGEGPRPPHWDSYRGAAHSKCNINYFTNRYLPVIFHNLKGYDSHHIIREAHKINQDIGQKDIKAIPNSYEKFMSFSIGDLKFIDSFQFMSSSLEKLAENLYDVAG
jgi:hypothetical protein